jgi:hypothetical protein
MEFGIMGVADIEPDPNTGYTPSEHERIQGVVESALQAEKLGFDVFAFGEHHNPRYLFDHPQPGISVARSGMALAPCRTHDPGGVAAGPGGVDGPLIGTRPPAFRVGLFVTWMPAVRRQTRDRAKGVVEVMGERGVRRVPRLGRG